MGRFPLLLMVGAGAGAPPLPPAQPNIPPPPPPNPPLPPNGEGAEEGPKLWCSRQERGAHTESAEKGCKTRLGQVLLHIAQLGVAEIVPTAIYLASPPKLTVNQQCLWGRGLAGWLAARTTAVHQASTRTPSTAAAAVDSRVGWSLLVQLCLSQLQPRFFQAQALRFHRLWPKTSRVGVRSVAASVSAPTPRR
jgi:hypothetical protein